MQDLLHLDAETARAMASELPAASDTGGFDTVAKTQDISSLHVRGYLRAADRALNAAIQLGPRPDSERFEIEYRKSPYLHQLSTQETSA